MVIIQSDEEVNFDCNVDDHDDNDFDDDDDDDYDVDIIGSDDR